MTRADPFAALLGVLDKRAARFGPDHTAVWGEYDGAAEVVLDDGRVIPNPMTAFGVDGPGRYPCVWMQGGHDILILAQPT